jgi:hypothetical protein
LAAERVELDSVPGQGGHLRTDAIQGQGSLAQNSDKTPKSAERKPTAQKSATDAVIRRDVDGLLPAFEQGMDVARTSKKRWPTERQRWESELRNVGFVTQTDIDALISSKTAKAAAAKVVARRRRISLAAVQNAYSREKSRAKKTTE